MLFDYNYELYMKYKYFRFLGLCFSYKIILSIELCYNKICIILLLKRYLFINVEFLIKFIVVFMMTLVI